MIIKTKKSNEVLLLQQLVDDFEDVEKKYNFKATIYFPEKGIKIKLRTLNGNVKAEIKEME